MDLLQFAVGVLVGVAISSAIPRIPVAIFSALKKENFTIVKPEKE